LTAASNGEGGGTISILALTLDRFEVYRTKYGDGAACTVLAQVARSVRRLGATVGIVAAAYRNGTIVLVAPELEAVSARDFGETLRATVAKLRLPNSEAVAADHVTASVAAITGRVKQSVDRVQLLTQAIARVQEAAGAGGNRVLAMSI
jgi:GGDEF domain-containing protein